MESSEGRNERLTQAVQELGVSIRNEARERWKGVKTAHRSHSTRHVWRFRTDDSEELFLHIPDEAILQSRGPKIVLSQLREAKWLDRLESGKTKAFVLAPSGRLRAIPGK